MRAAEYGIRLPDSILAAYAPFNVQWVPSPSRLLSLMDPLLPTGVLGACLAAYSGMGKSPFDDCTKNSIKSLTGEASQPINVVSNRTKTNSLLRLFRAGPKESKNARSSSNLDAHLPSGSESFHSCLSSSQSLESASVNQVVNSSSEAVVGYNCERSLPDCNGIVYHSSKTHVEHAASDHEKDWESSSTSSGRPHSRKHSQETLPSRATSPQRDHRETDHMGVHYHKDVEECHVVNVVESSDSPSGELLLYPLDAPEDRTYLKEGTPPVEDEEAELDDELLSGTTSMSQVCLPISKNPYMSPLLAPDDMLKCLPPIDLVVNLFALLEFP